MTQLFSVYVWFAVLGVIYRSGGPCACPSQLLFSRALLWFSYVPHTKLYFRLVPCSSPPSASVSKKGYSFNYISGWYHPELSDILVYVSAWKCLQRPTKWKWTSILQKHSFSSKGKTVFWTVISITALTGKGEGARSCLSLSLPVQYS